ncbi:MAG: NADP-dependent malic enzyme [Coriobacteriia bacterium]|nr:NADP-dependent malic enzyme [Coriobacteriia bacterium]
MSNIYEEALQKHGEWKGKISAELAIAIDSAQDLSLAYTPGVAAPCLEIQKDPHKAYDYTWKSKTIAVVSNGTAVLGLGNIGALASLPVMEGKCALFKRFGGVSAVPIVLDVQDSKELIATIKALAPSFGGINLEDIKAPECVEIERRLIEELDIPVFHDDQHGTAIVVTAALINSLKLIGKEAKDCVAVVSGAGAAGSSIARQVSQLGLKNIYVFDSKAVLSSARTDLNSVKQEMLSFTNKEDEVLEFADAMARADIFIGVSGPGKLNEELVSSMKEDAIVFAMANPEPEIAYDKAKAAGARIVATGRSDFPNQVNNVLVFPGIFKGMLQVPGAKITDEIKMAAARGLASCVSDEELSEEKVIPSVFDMRVSDIVAKAVLNAAQ